MLRLGIWASTDDFAGMDFPVKVLTGSLEQLTQRAVGLGYDGLEFMPDPDKVPDPEALRRAMQEAGATLLVVNSGRLGVQGYALLSRDAVMRRQSVTVMKTLLEFGGYLGSRVSLGAMCRGNQNPGITPDDSAKVAEDVFRELAEHAEKVGTVVMLEPAPRGRAYVDTTRQAVEWVKRINSPSFNLHLDIETIRLTESSFEYAIRAAEGLPDHIHLHDRDHWPPGLLPTEESVDWLRIAALLRATAFEGSGAVALAPRGDADAAARKTSAFLRELLG